MKRILLKLVILLIGFQSFAQNVELSDALINEYQEKQSVVALKSANVSSTQDHLWKTLFLRKVFSNWDNLTQEAKDIFEVYTTVPNYDGDEMVYTEGTLKIHYTVNSSTDNVVATDEGGNNVPDYVDSIAAAYSATMSRFHADAGLIDPMFNDDGFYHVYLSNTECGDGTYGYVQGDAGEGFFDNPSSPDFVEYDAVRSHMVLRSDYDSFGDTDEKRLLAMKVTVAHEYMHALQYSYDYDMDSWFMETNAVWGEEFVFPGADDNFQYLSQTFSTPDIALNVDDSEGEDYEGHWYGTFVFTTYMVEHTGDSIIGQLYQALVGDWQGYNRTTVEAFDYVLNEKWSAVYANFNALFADYVIANTILSEDAIFSPYVYSRANDYYAHVQSNYYTEDDFNYSGADIAFNSTLDGNGRLMRLSYDPFTLSSNSNFKLSFDGEGETDLILVKYSNSASEIVYADDNGDINVTDNEDWNGYYFAIVRWDSDETSTDSIDYDLTLTAATVIATQANQPAREQLSLVPNPANDYFVINGDVKVQGVIVLDISGRIVLTQSVVSSDGIDVSSLNPGTYFVEVSCEGMSPCVEQLIIK